MRTYLRWTGATRRRVLAALALAATGLVPIAAASAADAAPGPPAANVQVYPSPGTTTISPTQEIAFRGVSGSDLPTIAVTGSASGRHAGRWVIQSGGGGATWEPASSFTPGEHVTVTSSADVSGPNTSGPNTSGPNTSGPNTSGQRHTFSYTVSRPAAVSPQAVAAAINAGYAASRAARSATTNAATGNTITDSTALAAPTAPPPPYITRPDLQPPAVTTQVTGTTAPGLLLSTPLSLSANAPPGTQYGAEITNNQGQLVWFNPLPAGALDLQVINYMGAQDLAYHQNLSCAACTTTGFWVVLNNHYQQVATINPANGLQADGHSLEISPDGTKALLMAYNPITVDDSANGGPSNLAVLEGVIQEIDLQTGAMVFEWHSLGTDSSGQQFVPLSDSYIAASGPPPDDYIHLNSMQYVDNTTILFSARNTSAVYKLDLTTGQIVWRLGGKDTRNQFTFTDGDPGPSFAHDVQLRPDGTLGVFDNGVAHTPPFSRGVVYNIDQTNLTASLAQEYRHSPDLFGFIVGSSRLEPNGDQLTSFGSTGYADELNSAGQVVFASQTEVDRSGPMPNQIFSYRTLRADWHATPATPPAIVVSHPNPGSATVTASWNGATDVAGWQLYAGANAGSLRPVGTAPNAGFETTITAPAQPGDAVYQMRAVDASNNVLGASPASGDAIVAHYQALGGSSSALGAPIGNEQAVGAGLMQAYQGGNIYWSAGTGAFEVQGAILAHYLALGGPTGVLGFPTSDEAPTRGAGGRFNSFQVGVIDWSPPTGAFEVQGVVLDHYLALGGTASVLGFPTSDEQAAGPAGSGGRANTFQVGNIYFSPTTGALEVQGLILAHYLALGGPGGVLGFPTSDEAATANGGRFNSFQVGNLYFSPASGSFEVQGAILGHYLALGGPGGFLGFPTSDELPTRGPGGRFNNFQGGVIDWSLPTDAFEVHGAILARYLSLNGTASFLGFPTSDELGVGSAGRQSNFQNGNIFFSFNRGATSVG